MPLDSLLCQIPGENPPLVLEQMVRSPSGGVSLASSTPAYFPEHTDPYCKIAIPFGDVSLHVKWQTASGQQKHQHIRSGHVSVLPANLPHEATQERHMEMIVISIEPLWLEQLADELMGKPIEIIEQWAARDPFVHQLGVAMLNEFQLALPNVIYVESVIHILATHLLRQYSSNHHPLVQDAVTKLPPQKLQQAIAHIHNRLEQDVTLSELATMVQMSPYRFARAFKQSTGLPPHQYLLSKRIERAQILLRETQLAINDALGANCTWESMRQAEKSWRP
ncbi:hypothetical protein C7B61_01410 [filamentous cyanobacterium CCP1]|nr:hypothetical protein C7B61_01410 [filamentous cyanobacterium CCP1]